MWLFETLSLPARILAISIKDFQIMRLETRVRFLVLAVVFASIVPSGVRSESGDCYLRVSGKIYLNDRCNVMMGKGGGFSIGMVDTGAPSKYFASVNGVDAGSRKGDGFWNGKAAESHAQDPLGQLTKQGGCWMNAAAKVCAWKLGTKPSQF
ncbi:hypothetical protein [Methylobacterium sp. E-046]|uniref:hypothetical protein n=1 Tax=Methylobacterium sp. E-046 TaxID=2836576 RepID=UPI001FB9E9C9|nr:hypothetical protein [Methylobacterium sp. E-046]MCJ2099467.1 hypothetical protein [Methylobacterium sp. E-046]